MSVLNNSLLLGAPAGGAGYSISRSLRFNSSDSAYLSRTPASAGNRKTWTWSGWVKRSVLVNYQIIFSGGVGTSDAGALTIDFKDDALAVEGYSTIFRKTTQLFRDVSAWYHFVVAFDTTQSTASNRIKLYVNGSQITSFATSNDPTLNFDSGINDAAFHTIGQQSRGNAYSFNGYLADIYFIDGQALTPTSFGAFDATTGVWNPIAYTGSYGTNGFHLPFSDNSAATAAALGKDTSGNGNNWTPSNLSVTAGAGNDSLVDSPTNGTASSGGDAGGTVVGNYCTLNPVVNGANSSQITFANGNLEVTWSATTNYAVTLGTIGVSSGKWYWETTIDGSSGFWLPGVATAASSLTTYIGGQASSYGYYSVDGKTYNNNTASIYGNSYTTNDVIGVALDLDNGKIYFSKNGTWQNSGSPTGGTGEAYTGLSGTFFPAYAEGTASAATAYICNFGQRPFAYAAPSGFKTLCTANLTSTSITTSGTYTGNGVADGPFVYLNGVPTAMTVGGNAVTFGTHADKLSNGFKIRTTSTTYNQNASSYSYSITTTGDPFLRARAQSN